MGRDNMRDLCKATDAEMTKLERTAEEIPGSYASEARNRDDEGRVLVRFEQFSTR